MTYSLFSQLELSILIPDLNDWRWKYASEDKLKARSEIWGI